MGNDGEEMVVGECDMVVLGRGHLRGDSPLAF